MQRKLNLRIYDVNACLSHPNPGKRPFQEHLLASNKIFFQVELKDIKENGYQRVVLAETKPTKVTDPYQYTLPVLQQHFKNMLSADVAFDPFWSSPSDASKAALAKLATLVQDPAYTQQTLDANAISDVIALSHRAAATYPGENITLQIYTGTEAIGQTIELFFRKHPDFLPSCVSDMQIACYQNNQIVFVEGTAETPISGEGETDLTFFTNEKKITSALEWKNQNLLPAHLISTSEATQALLASREQPETVIEIQVPSQPASTSSQPSTASAEEMEQYISTVDIGLQDDSFRHQYTLGKITIEQLQEFLLPIYKAKHLQPSDEQLMLTLRNIASLPIWETKGKSLWTRTVPDGVADIKKHTGDLKSLASKIKPKLDDTIGSLKRSHMTNDFYHLIVTINNPHPKFNNCTREEVIKAFCKKWKVEYEMMAKQIQKVASPAKV